MQFANEQQRAGLRNWPLSRNGGSHPSPPDHDDECGHGRWSLSFDPGTGAGAAARNSIGLVLVGGMTIGTIFTLFIVPSLYMLIAKEHHEGRVDEPEEEPEIESDGELTPELVLARNGNGWKQG